MKTTFRNDEYVNSHGRDPKGHGMWVFRITLSDGNGSYSDGGFLNVTGTLTAAKKEARLRAKAMNDCSRCREVLIDVLP